MRRWFEVVTTAWAAAFLLSSNATAQPLGTFTWQLQPFCNKVVVDVVRDGAVYTLNGYDDQCGAPQRAPLVGLATLNPDGTIGLGFHIATAPGGKAVTVESRITLATVGGPWTDSAGNSGTLVLNGAAAGSPRPLPVSTPWGSLITSPPGTTGLQLGLRVDLPTVGAAVAGAAVFGSWGPVPESSTAAGLLVQGAGVVGTSGAGGGIGGVTDTGVGVVGIAATTGTGVLAVSDTGTALRANSGTGVAFDLSGPLKVSGAAGRRPMFRHVSDATTIVGARTVVNHPLLNGDPNAMVVATHVVTFGGPIFAGGVGVFYDTASGRWSIMREDGVVMPTGATFNVFVVKQ